MASGGMDVFIVSPGISSGSLKPNYTADRERESESLGLSL